MSWYGKHPVHGTKEEIAKKHPDKCKRCRYFYRVFGEWIINCGRCGQKAAKRKKAKA